MKLVALASLLLLLCAPAGFAQSAGGLRVSSVFPYDRVVPGQIVEVLVENVGEQLLGPPPGDALRILLTQDGATRTATARTANPGMVRDMAPGEPRPLHAISFAVPRGLRVGEAGLVVSFRGRKSPPFRLNVVERPQRPLVALTSIVSVAPAAVTPQSPQQRMVPKFERSAKGVEMRVMPLADPEDAEAAVVVRFRQGGTFHDAAARVVHRPGESRSLPGGGLSQMSPRDVLEVDVPEMLAAGEAEIEVSLRAGGLTGEAAVAPVVITDAERAFESPKAAAPRVLSVSPRRVGAGQALSISVDRRRALEPDPSKVLIVFESPDGASSRSLAPEINSATIMASMPSDVPVFLVVRAPKQMTGDVRVRVRNPARADYEGAASEPVTVEIVPEPLAPEVESVAEASAAELSQLREISPARASDSRVRYVSIRAAGLDPDPAYLRVRFEQEGRAPVTLERSDFALYSNGALVVRLPKGFGAGRVSLSVENRGANGYSAPAVRTFELPERR